MTPRAHTFNPHLFEVHTLEAARKLTVGDVKFKHGGEWSHEERWEPETALTVELILGHLPLHEDSVVLDYGCGTGRIAKEIIAKTGCRVVGADTSLSMAKLALEYVNSDRFGISHTSTLSDCGIKFDHVICVYVLMHVFSPQEELDIIKASSKSTAKLMMFNERDRHVPSEEGIYIDDGIDVLWEAVSRFGPIMKYGKLDPTRVHPRFSERTYWSTHRKIYERR